MARRFLVRREHRRVQRERARVSGVRDQLGGHDVIRGRVEILDNRVPASGTLFTVRNGVGHFESFFGIAIGNSGALSLYSHGLIASSQSLHTHLQNSQAGKTQAIRTNTVNGQTGTVVGTAAEDGVSTASADLFAVGTAVAFDGSNEVSGYVKKFKVIGDGTCEVGRALKFPDGSEITSAKWPSYVGNDPGAGGRPTAAAEWLGRPILWRSAAGAPQQAQVCVQRGSDGGYEWRPFAQSTS